MDVPIPIKKFWSTDPPQVTLATKPVPPNYRKDELLLRAFRRGLGLPIDVPSQYDRESLAQIAALRYRLDPLLTDVQAYLWIAKWLIDGMSIDTDPEQRAHGKLLARWIRTRENNK